MLDGAVTLTYARVCLLTSQHMVAVGRGSISRQYAARDSIVMLRHVQTLLYSATHTVLYLSYQLTAATTRALQYEIHNNYASQNVSEISTCECTVQYTV